MIMRLIQPCKGDLSKRVQLAIVRCLKCDSVLSQCEPAASDIRQPIKDSIRRSAYWIPVAICPIEIPLQRGGEEENEI